MGRWAIGMTARKLAAVALTLAVGATGIASARAQSFGGMNMLDLEAARDSFFSSADVDGDFALSSQEQLRALGVSNSQLFECWDEDDDGKCSYTEFMNSGTRVFEELDLDGDGHLTGPELQ